MDDLFTCIEGLSSEDLTSSILAYLLSSEDNSAFRKLFLFRVIPRELENINIDSDLEVIFQADLGKKGRADLLIESSEYLIIVENKFYASFSGDQPIRYVNYLGEFAGSRKAVFVLLALHDRMSLYKSKIQEMIPEAISIGHGNHFEEWFKSKNVEFITLTWEALLKDFMCGNEVVSQLSEFIKNRYLKNTIFTEKEVKMINTHDIPIIMEKLWATIDKAKDSLAGDDYKVKRTTQSRLFYGFAIEQPWGDIWLELYHNAWKDYATPFILQVRRSFFNDAFNADDIETALKNNGFTFRPEHEYVLPITIQENDILGVLVEKTKAVLELIQEEMAR